MANVNPPPQTAPPSTLRVMFGVLWPLWCVLALLVVVLAVLGGGARWLLATDEGTAWLLARLPMVQVQGLKGAALGDTWRADRVRIEWAGGKQWLLLEDVAADGLRWAWRPNSHAWLGLDADKLKVRQLTLHLGPPSGKPPVLPARIAPPLLLGVGTADIERAVIDTLAPWEQVHLERFVLDPHPGERLSAAKVSLRAYGVQVDGAAALANGAPYAIDAQAALRPLADGDNPRWGAVLRAGGTIPELRLAGTLRSRPQGGKPPPAVDLDAQLRPLQAWPLAALDLKTEALDLSALNPKAPVTSLSGTAVVKGGGNATTPLVADVQLANAAPGRWNEARLPLRTLSAQLEGQLARRDRLDVKRFELQLADARAAAGSLSGSAVWQADQLTIDSRLAALAPQRVDGRIAAMLLTGPFSATVRGLPSPDVTAPRPDKPVPPRIDFELDLEGKLEAAPQTVRLGLQAGADDTRLQVKRAHAESGSAAADFTADLQKAGNTWRVESAGALSNFDPVPWYAGPAGDAGAAWRKGPHRLSGAWQFDLRLPEGAERMALLTLTQRLAGNGNLRITDSQLAGVPLAAEFKLGYAPAGAPTPASLRAEITLGANQLTIDGRADPLGDGGADRWRAELKAERLGNLAPLAASLAAFGPAVADWVPRQGIANATLVAEGRWPDMRTEGTARVSQLQAGPLAVALANAQWRLDTRGNFNEAPLNVQADLAGLSLSGAGKAQRADHLRAELRGTLAAHRIELSAALPIAPPQVAEQVLGIQAQSGTRALLWADGAWRPDGGSGAGTGGARWVGRIERLLVGSWDGSVATAPPASGWAEGRDLRAELVFDANRRLVSMQADPGRITFAQQVAMRWDEIKVDLRGERAQIQLNADIEPFTLAPLLARAQPGMGWRGDMKLAARIAIRAADKFDADLVFERREGDLAMSAGDITSPLGLTDLKLTVSAHDGQWVFTPRFRGRILGEIEGDMRVATRAELRWPTADATLSGRISARAADIGIWSAWVPVGWRLGGEVVTMAELSGTFGDPRFTGELRGKGLAARNLLEGVNVSDGEVAVTLAGETARIDRFTFKGGDGLLTLTGGAALGRKPEMRLQAKAERFRVFGRVDRQLTASGNAQMVLTSEALRLDGSLAIDEGLFDASRRNAPSLDEDVTVRRPGQVEEAPADPAAPKTKFGVQVAVDVDLGERVRFKGWGVDTTLGGKVRVAAPGGRPQLFGTITSVGGTYAAYAQKLEIERGIVAFSGPIADPRLDILALRPNLDVRVGAAITGNVSNLRIRLFSEPEMSDADKLSWLVLGRAPDGLGRNDTALLQRAAVALLAGEGEAPTDALMRALGIDDVSLRQAGEGDVRETVISIGKQLSRRWYLGYERGVNATTGTWQLTYRIAQRFTLRAQSGLENALDVIWSWRLQETPADAGVRNSVTVVPKR